ncbi:hypothetical protein [Bradyrhizobium guangdongense]
MKKALRVVLIVLVGIFVGLIWLLWPDNAEYQRKIQQASTPEQLVTTMLPGARVDGESGPIRIDYTVKSILSATNAVSNFNLQTVRLVPAIFAKFPKVESIVFVEEGPFTDIKGSTSTDVMFRIAFMREEADTIHWDNINYDNVPRLGEHYFMHPGIRRALTE